jgi:hypothetical protein
MAVGAVQQVPPPSLPDAGNVRQLVAQSGGDQDPPGTHGRGAGQPDLEAGLHADHGVVDQAAAVAGHLGSARGEQVGGWHAVAGQEAVHVRGWRIAGPAGIDHNHRAPGPQQHQGRAQAGSAATDHQDVVFVHGPPD